MKGRTGTAQSYEFRSPRIRKGLMKSLGFEPTPRVPLKPDPRLRRMPVDPNDPITDKVLSHMRWDHEMNGMKPKDIARKYEFIDTYGRVHKLLDYATRAHVMPRDPGLD